MLNFMEKIREYNIQVKTQAKRVAFYGLDLYCLSEAMQVLIDYLQKHYPEAATEAMKRYACFDHVGLDPQQYGYLTNHQLKQSCVEEMADYDVQKRLEMVEMQLRARGIQDPRVLKSMGSVPRHLFVSSALEDQAYDEDMPLPIGYHQTISQPYIVAFMAQAANLKPTDIALEIGTGCRYAAAVLPKLVKKIYTIEFVLELASKAQNKLKDLGYSNVTVLQGDGSTGLKEYAPFDAILVTADAPIIPQSLKEQLAINGRLSDPPLETNLCNKKVILTISSDLYV